MIEFFIFLTLIPFIHSQQGSLRCGSSWSDANTRCGTLCPSATNAECSSGQSCFASLDLNPCFGKRCGTTWTDASLKCGVICPLGVDSQCPSGQYCFASLPTTICSSTSAPTPTPTPTPTRSPTPTPVSAPIPVAPKPASTSKFVIYIDYIPTWTPAGIADALGLPGYSRSHSYNVINLAFWTTNQGPADTAKVWQNLVQYVPSWGTTTDEIQKKWISIYHAANIKVLVSAFGATDAPTTSDATTVAKNLASFVTVNNLDGVDLDYEDSSAFSNSIAEKWLCDCSRTLRSLLPGKIITHAPQAPYFMGAPSYPAGGYTTIEKTCGSAIDWYNVQFYNQDSTSYDTYNSLFITSGGWAAGTSVGEIVARGVPAGKLVIGKGVTRSDVYNTGFIDVGTFKGILNQGVNNGYTAGFMGWQFSSDTTGSWSTTLASVFPKTGAVIDEGNSGTNAANNGFSPLQIGLIVLGSVLGAVLLVFIGVVVFKAIQFKQDQVKNEIC